MLTELRASDFPYTHEIPEDVAEILLGPSWTAGTWVQLRRPDARRAV